MSRLLRRGVLADAVVTGPTILASDTFNRADGAIGTSSSGHTWTELGSSTGWTVASNQARPPTSGYDIAVLNAGDADVEVQVTVDPKNSTPDLGPVCKVSDADNLIWYDVVYDTDHWLCRVFQRVAGSFSGNGLTTLVNPVVTLGSDKTTPFEVRLQSVGQAGEVWINDVSQGTWSSLIDTGILSATSHGLAGNAVLTAAYDDLTITAA